MSSSRQTTLFQSWGKSDTTSSVPQADSTNDLEDLPEDDALLLAACQEWESAGSDTSHLEDHPATSSSKRTAQVPLFRANQQGGNSVIPPLPPQGTALEDLPGFDVSTGDIWIYPTNYPVRDYQFNIVQQALFRNTMVTLPTGLGKTFIAAVVMYNFYRWYPQGKVVFMAPTKPLVAQQIEACYNVMGIPQTHMSEMTGNMAPAERKKAWFKKRVFFLTPQVLMNDVSRRTCPAEEIKCLVVDEAHKALGNHAYCQVVKELSKYSLDFRVLALSATPGGDLKAVQQVLRNMLVAHIEIRSEDSIDIRQYVHERKVEKVVVPLGEELKFIRDQFLQVLTVYTQRLRRCGVLYNKDPATLTKFEILRMRDGFRQDPPQQVTSTGAVEGDFAISISLYHGYELLLQHGMRSLYNFLQSTVDPAKGLSRTKQELLRNGDFRNLMEILHDKFDTGADTSLNGSRANLNSSRLFTSPGKSSQRAPSQPRPFVMSHPKLARLQDVVVDHFKNFKTTPNTDENKPTTSKATAADKTRVMIFAQYRDSVHEITEMLNRHRPLIRCMSFIGQASGGKTTKGFTQKEQLRVVREFREGGYNTLVSTCVGEEGLDIGDVDLIVCYDAHKSPIRLVQRMGRTGRKREGRIVMLVTEGKESAVYDRSQYNKKGIHRALQGNSKSLQLYTNSPRMVPRGLHPRPHKIHITVPEYKTNQTKDRKGSGPGRKQSAGGIMNYVKPCKPEDRCFLTSDELAQWSESYQIHGPEANTISKVPDGGHFVTLKGGKKTEPKKDQTPVLSLNQWSLWQNKHQPTINIDHSNRTKNFVELMQFIELQGQIDDDDDPYGLEMQMYLDEEDIIKPRKKKEEEEKGIRRFCKKASPVEDSGSEDEVGVFDGPTGVASSSRGKSERTGKDDVSGKKRIKKRRTLEVFSEDEVNSSDEELPNVNLDEKDEAPRSPVFHRENFVGIDDNDSNRKVKSPVFDQGKCVVKETVNTDEEATKDLKKGRGVLKSEAESTKGKKKSGKKKARPKPMIIESSDDDDFEDNPNAKNKNKSPAQKGLSVLGKQDGVVLDKVVQAEKEESSEFDDPEPMDTGDTTQPSSPNEPKSPIPKPDNIQASNISLGSSMDGSKLSLTADLSNFFPNCSQVVVPKANRSVPSSDQKKDVFSTRAAIPPPPPSMSSLDLLDDMNLSLNATPGLAFLAASVVPPGKVSGPSKLSTEKIDKQAVDEEDFLFPDEEIVSNFDDDHGKDKDLMIEFKQPKPKAAPCPESSPSKFDTEKTDKKNTEPTELCIPENVTFDINCVTSRNSNLKHKQAMPKKISLDQEECTVEQAKELPVKETKAEDVGQSLADVSFTLGDDLFDDYQSLEDLPDMETTKQTSRDGDATSSNKERSSNFQEVRTRIDEQAVDAVNKRSIEPCDEWSIEAIDEHSIDPIAFEFQTPKMCNKTVTAVVHASDSILEREEDDRTKDNQESFPSVTTPPSVSVSEKKIDRLKTKNHQGSFASVSGAGKITSPQMVENDISSKSKRKDDRLRTKYRQESTSLAPNLGKINTSTPKVEKLVTGAGALDKASICSKPASSASNVKLSLKKSESVKDYTKLRKTSRGGSLDEMEESSAANIAKNAVSPPKLSSTKLDIKSDITTKKNLENMKKKVLSPVSSNSCKTEEETPKSVRSTKTHSKNSQPVTTATNNPKSSDDDEFLVPQFDLNFDLEPQFDLDFDLDNLDDSELEGMDIIPPSPTAVRQQEYLSQAPRSSFNQTVSRTVNTPTLLQARNNLPVRPSSSTPMQGKKAMNSFAVVDDDFVSPISSQMLSAIKKAENLTSQDLTFDRSFNSKASPALHCASNINILEDNEGQKSSTFCRKRPLFKLGESHTKEADNNSFMRKRKSSSPLAPPGMKNNDAKRRKSAPEGNSEEFVVNRVDLGEDPAEFVVNRVVLGKDPAPQMFGCTEIEMQHLEEVTGDPESHEDDFLMRENPADTTPISKVTPTKDDSESDEDLIPAYRKRKKATALESPSTPTFKTPGKPPRKLSRRSTDMTLPKKLHPISPKNLITPRSPEGLKETLRKETSPKLLHPVGRSLSTHPTSPKNTHSIPPKNSTAALLSPVRPQVKTARKTSSKLSSPVEKSLDEESDSDDDDIVPGVRRRRVRALESPLSQAVQSPEGLAQRVQKRLKKPGGVPAKISTTDSDDDFDMESPLIRRAKKLSKPIVPQGLDDDNDDDFEDGPFTKVLNRPTTKKSSSSSDDVQRHCAKARKKKKKRTRQDAYDVNSEMVRGFLDEDAEVSDLEECSTDESGSDLDDSLDGFINNASQMSQQSQAVVNQSDMHAIYMKSVRSPEMNNRFKMVRGRNHNMDVFSQVPVQDESYYEDSFVVDGGDDREEDDIVAVSPPHDESLFENTINVGNILAGSRRSRRRGATMSKAERILKRGRRKILSPTSSSDDDVAEVVDDKEKRARDGRHKKAARDTGRTGSMQLKKDVEKPEIVQHFKETDISQGVTPYSRCNQNAGNSKLDGKLASRQNKMSASSSKTALGTNLFLMNSSSEPKIARLNQEPSVTRTSSSSDVTDNDTVDTMTLVEKQKAQRLERQREQQRLFRLKMEEKKKQQEQCAKKLTSVTVSHNPLPVPIVHQGINKLDRSESVMPPNSTVLSRTSMSSSRNSNVTGSSSSAIPGRSSYGGNDQMFQKQASTSASGEDGVQTTLTSPLKGSQKKLAVLIDSKELASSSHIVSTLTLQYNINATVCQLTGCDFIVSNRMGVEKKTWSDFTNGANKTKLVDRMRHLCELFDRPCLIIEKDRVKPRDEKKPKTLVRTKYLDATLANLAMTHIKVFFSESVEDTARILSELARAEAAKGTAIPTLPDMDQHTEQVFKFYQSIPRVSYPLALSLLINFSSIQEVMTSSIGHLQRKGKLSPQRAKDIHQFLRHKYDEQMTGGGSGK